MEFKAHIFTSSKAANEAIQHINKSLGIPVSPDAITQNYTIVEQHDKLYIIRADETTESILGESQTFEIIETYDI
jgi:hypothetical protein